MWIATCPVCPANSPKTLMNVKPSDSFIELVTQAHEYLTRRQDNLRKEFHLDDWPRWDWDQETGQIVFSKDGQPRVVADIVFVGSVSTVSNTWLWSWANPHLDSKLTRPIEEVRAFGEAHCVEQLTTPKWEADEVDGWEMTSISAYILQAKGAYRTPEDIGFSYMIFTDVRWAESTGAYGGAEQP